MQKTIKLAVLLFFVLFGLSTLGAAGLDTPLNPLTPKKTVRSALCELNTTLPPKYKFSLQVLEKTASMLIAPYLQTKFNEYKKELEEPTVTRVQQIITDIEKALNNSDLSLIEQLKLKEELLRRREEHENRQHIKFALWQKRYAAKQKSPLGRRPAASATELAWTRFLNPSLAIAPRLSVKDLNYWIDTRLYNFAASNTALTYAHLIFWLKKKCAIEIDTSTFSDHESLLDALLVKLEIFFDPANPPRISAEDLKTTWSIYCFLKNQGKNWELFDLGPILAAVDEILAFVKLPQEPVSPVSVTEL